MAAKPTTQQINAKAQRAMALAQRGDLMRAAALLAPVMPHAKDMLSVVELYADIRTTQGHVLEGAELYRRVLKTRRDAQQTRNKLVACLRRAGRFDEAVQQIERIRETDPWGASAVLSLVDIYSAMGMRDAAIALLDEFETNAETKSLDTMNRARVMIARLRNRRDAADVPAALEMAADDSLHGDVRAALATHAGTELQRAGRYSEAFDAFASAKTARGLAFDAGLHERRVGECIAFWTEGEGADLPPSGEDGSGMIFIVGMPRSGTSLLEQMLGRLPGVTPLAERAEIIRIAGAICTPEHESLEPLVTEVGRYTKENIDAIMPRIVGELREAALAAEPDPDGRQRLVDKQVYNFQHLPLIAKVLPGAKVLHIARNPADTAISCFSQWFNREHQFTSDMASLGAYYKQYRRMVDAWRGLPAPGRRPEMHELAYEQLAREPERVMRGVLEFLGLGWDDRVLTPEQSDRIVLTASREQVRESINTAAIGRWKHYERQLEPFFEAAGPEIAAEAKA